MRGGSGFAGQGGFSKIFDDRGFLADPPWPCLNYVLLVKKLISEQLRNNHEIVLEIQERRVTLKVE